MGSIVKTYDDVLPLDYMNKIEDFITKDANFKWMYLPSTLGKAHWSFDSDDIIDSFQFVHMFYSEKQKPNSDYFPLVLPLYTHLYNHTKIKISRIFRVKANFCTNVTRNTEKNYQPPHKDNYTDEANIYSLIYYVIDSDGDTLFFDENKQIVDRVSPKKGRIALFPSNIVHAGTNPVKHDTRIVINTVMFKD